MAIAKIQTGDKVIITTGNFKGTQGVVTKIKKYKNKKRGVVHVRAAVSTIDPIVTYRRPNRSYNVPGQMLTTSRMIDVSNLRLVDDTGNLSKVRIEEDVNGFRYRVYKTTGTRVTKSAAVNVADEPTTEQFKNK